MPRHSLDLQKLPQPERQRYAECCTDGCNRHPRSFSRFCTLHARNFYRTRDPNGRAVRVRELKPFLVLAEEYLSRHAEHPAVAAAEDFLRVSLVDFTQPREIRKQLERLRVDGATPRAMLVSFLGVWGLGHYHPHSVTTDECRAFNLGNRVLRTTPMPSFKTPCGTRQPVRLPARVAETYGLYLRARLGVFADRFWSFVQNELEAPEHSARAIATAIREFPFGFTHATPTL